MRLLLLYVVVWAPPKVRSLTNSQHQFTVLPREYKTPRVAMSLTRPCLGVLGCRVPRPARPPHATALLYTLKSQALPTVRLQAATALPPPLPRTPR